MCSVCATNIPSSLAGISLRINTEHGAENL